MISIEKQIYLCKYHEIDNKFKYSIGITNAEAYKILEELKRKGLYEKYRNLTEEEYEKIIGGY